MVLTDICNGIPDDNLTQDLIQKLKNMLEKFRTSSDYTAPECIDKEFDIFLEKISAMLNFKMLPYFNKTWCINGMTIWNIMIRSK